MPIRIIIWLSIYCLKGAADLYIWLGMFLFTFMWYFIVPFYVPSNITWIPLLILGVLFILLGCRRCSIRSIDTSRDKVNHGIKKVLYPGLLIPLIAAAVLMPLQWKIASVLLFSGLVSLLVFKDKKYVALGFLSSGIIVILQSLMVELYWKIGPRLQGENIFDSIAAFIGKITGFGGISSGSTVFLKGSTGTSVFLSTWDKFGLFLLLLAVAGAIGIFLFYKTDSKHKILKITAIFLIYWILRYTFLITMLADDGHIDIFWSMPIQILTFIFLPFILNRFISLGSIRYGVSMDGLVEAFSGKRVLAAVLAAFLSFTGLFTAFMYNEPGVKKSGNVLVDEKHSDWEWTDKTYDTNWYGEMSNYNYYCLYDYYSHYYNINRNYEDISDDLLSKVDILILKTPTEAYDKSETDSIVRFVDRGGSLFMIGDHTNVFGMDTNLNEVASRFGFKYNYDSTYDLATGSLSEYEHPDMLPHPAVQRLPHFLFATSCTIDAPIWAEDIITGYSLKALYADYSQDNFFPEEGNTGYVREGLFLQSIGIRYGKGRIAAFSDSTVFSNFWMFMTGKPELALGIMEWLNRYNSFPAVTVFSGALGFVLLVFLIRSLKGMKRAEVLLVLYTGIFTALLVSIIICRSASALNYTVQTPKTPYTMVAYEREYSDYNLPVSVQEFMMPLSRQFDTFYVWNQRIGLVPYAASSVGEAAEKGDVIVVMNPKRRISSSDAEILKDAVQKGKKLLLLGADKENIEAYNSFAQIFGLQLTIEQAGNRSAYYNNGKVVNLTGSAYAVKGGTPFIATDEGIQAGCEVKYGKGDVMAFGDGEIFYSSSIGNMNLVPNTNQEAVAELEYWMFKHLTE